MSVIVNAVRPGFYRDSVALMRISRQISAGDGVEEAGLMMGTPANKRIMDDAGVLAGEGRAAGPGDLVLAIRAVSKAAADVALAAAQAALTAPRGGPDGASAWRPRSIRSAVAANPAANLALISVPGDFAAAEAMKALARGLNVMMFSDNVSIADEVMLKTEARARGLLMMGPDCGTAILNGVPLAFANVVPRGDIGIVGASGTGIQEVSCLIARNGGGISQAIGTGGRDLKAEVGGITTLMAIDLLDADPATRHIVVISKPPAAAVAASIVERIARSGKTFTVCFIGAKGLALPANASLAATLKGAAQLALGKTFAEPTYTVAPDIPAGRFIRGLYAGGTLCAEAQFVLLEAGVTPISNVPIPGSRPTSAGQSGHLLIDLGDDEYTQGRPHPMIEPGSRDAPLLAALDDPDVGVILLDIVLGTGGHGDPAGHLARVHQQAMTKPRRGSPLLIGSITGTEGDPQRWHEQYEKLAAIAIVCPSNADAAHAALRFVGAVS